MKKSQHLFYRFKVKESLTSHLYSMHRGKRPKTDTCEICGKSFVSKFHLKLHKQTHTDITDRLAERKQCEHCGEWLMTRSGIYYHKQVFVFFSSLRLKWHQNNLL